MDKTIPHDANVPVLYEESEIKERIEDLAQEIAKAMPGELMIVGLLKGSFMFLADLIRELSRIGVHPQIDFLSLSSYGTGTKSSGEVVIHRDMTEAVEGKQVLIIDDILETGNTLDTAQKLLKERGAVDMKVCMLLEKPGKLDKAVKADFVGFRIGDRFVVGYGLDYANHYRELPYIGVLDIH